MNNLPSQFSQNSQSSHNQTGNKIFKTLGATNHSSDTRQPDDFYATDPVAARLLLQVEHFDKNIWECACGQKAPLQRPRTSRPFRPLIRPRKPLRQ